MKQISARQFRTSFADLTEPVTVLRRDGAEFRVLGTWIPVDVSFSLGAAKLAFPDLDPVGFGGPRPAPKGGRR